MQRWPLNRHATFERWPAFDPGRWIDFNPTCVQLPGGGALALIRRDQAPPEPGKGTIWQLPLDEQMRPAGPPQLLVARGEDPRAIVVGQRLLLFYCVIDRDADDRVCGSTMKLAEFDIEDAQAGRTLTMKRAFELPKNPLGIARPGDREAAWEKNWVPFAVSAGEVALIYSHDPWHVIVLDVDPASEARRFLRHHPGPALKWRHGQIRGGTPPLPWADGRTTPPHGEQLISFFHSSAVVGSRKLYMVGAVTFDRAAPHTPRAITRDPLLVAPYRSGAHRFGWRFAGSVVFPLGAERGEEGYRLLCGLDDGEIGSFVVPHAALAERLEPLDAEPAYVATDLDEQHRPVAGALWLRERGAAAGAPLSIARFAEHLCGPARTFVDTAAADGAAVMTLAPQFQRVLAFAADARQRALLARNTALNGFTHVGIGAGEVFALDTLGLAEVDLVKIDEHAAEVVAGAAELLRRCRPALLVQDADPESLRALLAGHGYTHEPVGPREPGWVLALPQERRAAWQWWV